MLLLSPPSEHAVAAVANASTAVANSAAVTTDAVATTAAAAVVAGRRRWRRIGLKTRMPERKHQPQQRNEM